MSVLIANSLTPALGFADDPEPELELEFELDDDEPVELPVSDDTAPNAPELPEPVV